MLIALLLILYHIVINDTRCTQNTQNNKQAIFTIFFKLRYFDGIVFPYSYNISVDFITIEILYI